ncbi:PepSY domain-containing protein [Sporolactobacillus sp. Y61]|uniref:PepSY domain-containing protein n=1 Tax=Sporolactobacillus sp. Y61 TaxID=3160863 RepID=A0AAU8IFF6_9BACL
MKKKKAGWIAGLTLFTLVTAAGVALAMDYGERIPEDRIASAAVERYGGKILSVRLENQNGREVYLMALRHPRGEYQLTLDAETGSTVALKKTKNASSVAPAPETITEKQAGSIATKRTGGAILSVEKGELEGRAVYTVRTRSGSNTTELKIGAADGAIISEQALPAPEQKKEPKTVISEQEARTLALKKVKGTVIRSRLEENDDQYEYQVTIQSGKGTAEVYVHAYSGKTSISWNDDDADDETDESENEQDENETDEED